MLEKHADFKINILRKRLVDSNARSVFVNAHPKKSKVKIDLLSLSQISTAFHNEQFLNHLLFNNSFEINTVIDFNTNETESKKTFHLFRKNEAYKNEFNLDPIGLGYPLLLIKPYNKKQYQLTPIFIWDVTLKQFTSEPSKYSYKINNTESVSLNPSLKRYLKQDSNEESIQVIEEIKNNPEELIRGLNALLKLEGEKPISKEFLLKPIIALPENLDEEFMVKNQKLINNGVLGLYANTKEPIIADYFTLEEKTIPCHIKPSRDINSTQFSGMALDHSQQGVIRSLLNRRNTIIHGPPGTGKSKTITAVLNYALSKGQKCLLVCEKKSAMDVIYDNLEDLGISDFAVKITDVKKDRRAIVDKARAIIEIQKKGIENIFEKKSIGPEPTIEKQELVERRIKNIAITIELISKIKRKLYLPLLDGQSTYSDLVLKNQNNDQKKLSKILKLNVYNFEFSSSEWNHICNDLNNLKLIIVQNTNPYETYYSYLNKSLLSLEKETFFQEKINSIYRDYFRDLKSLIKEWKQMGEQFSTYEIKYFNYIKSENLKLQNLFNRYTYLKKKTTDSLLFDPEFVTQLERLEPLSQLEKIFEVLGQMKKEIEKFNLLIPFHNYITKLNRSRKECFIQFCKIKDFEKLFHNWYIGNILEKNYVSDLDFNGFEKGYFDLVEDLDKINNHYSALAKKINKSDQISAISSFERNKDQTIEQFFSKRSSTVRTKLPLHKITRDSSNIFLKLFPVVITNPSSCSCLFPMERGFFDFVVFDESSQLRVEETFPALLRGKISIVSGDTHQLPPSNYFREIEKSNDAIPEEENTSSLLEFCKNSSFNNHYLDIHYRSNHPDLIQFSNHAFYQKRLIPLPPKKKYRPIQFIAVNGLFTNRTNVKEARTIVDYLSNKIYSNESLGIATFSQFQQNLILYMILKKTIVNPKFKAKINDLKKRGLFVKNIENIQGEERDIMLISTTYGPNKLGKFNQFFGPLNIKNKGHKLLNVVVSRAIKKMVVFSSVPEKFYESYDNHIKLNGVIGKGVFYAFISYAKAVSENDVKKKQKILDALYESSSVKRSITNFKKEDLIDFTKYLIQLLGENSTSQIDWINQYELGGITYEIMLKVKDNIKLLIDLNGKEVNKAYEDYLYDIYRCKIAQNSGFRYYRLWLSNFYNHPQKEIKKILEALND